MIKFEKPTTAARSKKNVAPALTKKTVAAAVAKVVADSEKKKMEPAPLIIPPELAERMQKEGLSLDGVKVLEFPAGGAPAKTGKKMITIRLDPDVIDGFKALGKGWNGKINGALRQHLGI